MNHTLNVLYPLRRRRIEQAMLDQCRVRLEGDRRNGRVSPGRPFRGRRRANTLGLCRDQSTDPDHHRLAFVLTIFCVEYRTYINESLHLIGITCRLL